MSEPGLFQAFREGANKSDHEITARWFRFFLLLSIWRYYSVSELLEQAIQSPNKQESSSTPLGLEPYILL